VTSGEELYTAVQNAAIDPGMDWCDLTEERQTFWEELASEEGFFPNSGQVEALNRAMVAEVSRLQAKIQTLNGLLARKEMPC
jgi:hypothetical protein